VATEEHSTKLQAYAVSTLAKSNDVSVAYLRGEIAAGRLRAHRIGLRQYRILAEDWEAYRNCYWTPAETKPA
jgi:excisionase family DNA binding protein